MSRNRETFVPETQRIKCQLRLTLSLFRQFVKDQILIPRPFKQVSESNTILKSKWTGGLRTEYKMRTRFESISAKLDFGL